MYQSALASRHFSIDRLGRLLTSTRSPQPQVRLGFSTSKRQLARTTDHGPHESNLNMPKLKNVADSNLFDDDASSQASLSSASQEREDSSSPPQRSEAHQAGRNLLILAGRRVPDHVQEAARAAQSTRPQPPSSASAVATSTGEACRCGCYFHR